MEKSRMRCVVIGGSAGSLKVILELLPALKTPINLPIIFVLHRLNDARSSLEVLMASKTTIPIRAVEDKETLQPGMIYVAPADYHLLIEKTYQLSLDGSEKVWYSRPSIDVTFQSAAEVFGPGLLGIVMSGANQDGAKGLAAIKAAGGAVGIQDPVCAENAVMPRSAMMEVKPDYLLQNEEIGDIINYWSDLLTS